MDWNIQEIQIAGLIPYLSDRIADNTLQYGCAGIWFVNQPDIALYSDVWIARFYNIRKTEKLQIFGSTRFT